MAIRVIGRRDEVQIVPQAAPLSEVMWQEPRRRQADAEAEPTAPASPPPPYDGPTPEPARWAPGIGMPELPSRFPLFAQVTLATVGILALFLAGVLWIGVGGGAPRADDKTVTVAAPGQAESSVQPIEPAPASLPPSLEPRIQALEGNLSVLQGAVSDLAQEVWSPSLQPVWTLQPDKVPFDHRFVLLTVSLEAVPTAAESAFVRITNIRTGQAILTGLRREGGRYTTRLTVILEPTPLSPLLLYAIPGDPVLLEWLTAPEPMAPHLEIIPEWRDQEPGPATSGQGGQP